MLDALNELRQHYAQRIRALRLAIAKSGQPSRSADVRGLAGQIGGESRRYRQALIVALTDWAVRHSPDAEATKHRVQGWQKHTFGQAVSNGTAVRWCDPARDPGDRGVLEVPAPISAACSVLFLAYWSTPDQDLAGPRTAAQLADLVALAVAGQAPEASAA